MQEAVEINASSLVETFEVEEVISETDLPDDWDGNCIPFFDYTDQSIYSWMEELNDE